MSLLETHNIQAEEGVQERNRTADSLRLTPSHIHWTFSLCPRFSNTFSLCLSWLHQLAVTGELKRKKIIQSQNRKKPTVKFSPLSALLCFPSLSMIMSSEIWASMQLPLNTNAENSSAEHLCIYKPINMVWSVKHRALISCLTSRHYLQRLVQTDQMQSSHSFPNLYPKYTISISLSHIHMHTNTHHQLMSLSYPHTYN